MLNLNTLTYQLLYINIITSVLPLKSNLFLLLCWVCQHKTSANSYQECHVVYSSTIAYVQWGCDTNKLQLLSQHASRGTENEQESGSECQLVPVHPGGRALRHHRGIHPLFPCAQGLLEGPPDENEGLWNQHPHNVGKLLWMCFVLCHRLNVNREHLASLQICAVESAPARERGFQLPHTAGFRVRSSVTWKENVLMINHHTVCCLW